MLVKISHALVLVAVLVGPVCVSVIHAEDHRPVYRPISLSLVYPVTTFVRTDPIIAGLSLNLLDGGHRAVYGLEVGAVVNRTRELMAGVQVAGVTNIVSGGLRGLQLAGGVNVVLRPSAGGQIAGLWNHASSVWNPSESGYRGVQLSAIGNSADLMTGLQLAPAVNVAGEMQGVQLSYINVAYLRMDGLQLGLGNLHVRMWVGTGREPGSPSTKSEPTGGRFQQLFKKWVERQLLATPPEPLFQLVDVRSHLVQIGAVNMSMHLVGAQVGAFINAAARLEGLQLSAIGNIAMLHAHGAQISGFCNFAGTYVKGLQLALVNVCGSLRGAQVGLINICGRVKGAQLGIINIAYRNRVPFLPGLNIGI